MGKILTKRLSAILASFFLFGMAATATEQMNLNHSQLSAVGASAAAVAVDAVQQQNVQVTGRVTDSHGPVIGATVMVLGTSLGTTTDFDGNFTLSVPAGSRLQVSFIGMVTQEFHITQAQHLNVHLLDDAELLDDVVVIGFGTQRRSVVSAAISSVRGEDIARQNPTRIDQLLRGQAAGISITQQSGAPNAAANVRVRGVGTTGDNAPLWVVDGMIMEGGIQNLNPADIANIEILKDAASAAVFGARGGNGVIMVTTHRGQAGRPVIQYNLTHGLQNVARRMPRLNSEQYMLLMNERAVNDGVGLPFSAQDFTDLAAGRRFADTDWQEVAFGRNVPVTSHQLSVRGGTETGTWFMSLGYFSHDGILGGEHGVSNYSRWNIRVNMDQEIFRTNDRNFLNRIRVGVNTTYARGNSIGMQGGNTVFGSVLASAFMLPPIMPVYMSPDAPIGSPERYWWDSQLITENFRDMASNYGIRHNGQLLATSPHDFQEARNPLATFLRPRRHYSNEDNFIGNFWGEVDILPGLRFRSNLGYQLSFWGYRNYRFPDFVTTNIAWQQDIRYDLTYASRRMERQLTRDLSNTLTYDFTIQDQHNFNIVLGQTARLRQHHWVRGSGTNINPFMMTDNVMINNSLMPNAQRNAEGANFTETSMSYFARLSYDFDSRYMFQATVRRDGSMRFGPGNKWGTFPSFSLGWNVWNEPTFEDARPQWFDTLRPRFSWGINGNDRIAHWTYLSMLTGGNNFHFNDDLSAGMAAGRMSNRYVHWEEVRQTNIGLDLAFLRNALTLSVDAFDMTTTGMLRDAMHVPGYVGQQVPMVNTGEVSNRGIEFDLGYRFSPVRDLHIGIRANASFVRNEIVTLGNVAGQHSWGGEGALGLANMIFQRNGMPNPFFYGFRTAGIAQNQAQADAYNDRHGLTGANAIAPGDVMFQRFAVRPDGTTNGPLLPGSPEFDEHGNRVVNGDRVKLGTPIPDWTWGLTLTADFRNWDFSMFWQGVVGADIFDISTRDSDIPNGNRPAWWMDRWHGEGTSDRIPRFVSGTANVNNWRVSDLWVRSGDFVRLRNIQLGYTIPRHITQMASIEALRLWVGAENLLTFTRFEGLDPEIGGTAAEGGSPNHGISRLGTYPQARTINFGLGLTF